MKNAEPVTMHRVAQIAGVSVSMVSRVMNGTISERPELQERIFKAADTLGYKRLRRRSPSLPSVDREGQRKRLTGCIAFLMSEMRLQLASNEDGIYREMLSSAREHAEKSRFHLVLTSYDCADKGRMPSVVENRQVDGVIWTSHYQQDIIERIADTVPLVLLNNCISWPPIPCVAPDNQMILYKAVEYLQRLGHRRIAYFGVSEEAAERAGISIHVPERHQAFLKAVGHFRLEPDPNLCRLEQFGINEHPAAVARAMDSLMKLAAPPTAIITSLTYAITFMGEANRRGIRIPRDLSLIATDDGSVARLMVPALTTIDSRHSYCARLAIEALIRKLSEPDTPVQTVRVEPNLIARESTAQVPEG